MHKVNKFVSVFTNKLPNFHNIIYIKNFQIIFNDMKTAKNAKMKRKEDSKHFVEKEIDLHIAEYNTLTNRATNFINIQFVLLTALLAWVVVIGQIWNPNLNYLLSWGLLLGAQIIGVINSNMAWETYTIVRYIESDLRPKVVALIKKESFWNYESYLTTQRGVKLNFAWVPFMDFFWVVLAGIVLAAVTIYRFQNWAFIDWVLFIINLVIFIAMTIRTYHTVRMKVREWK